MSSPTPWMKFYVRDYLNDLKVKTLSLEEKGLYTDMLFIMWDNGGFLPADFSILSKILGISEKKFAKIFQKISFFFQKTETDEEVFFTQKRLLEELDKLKEISRERSQAGKKGVVAKQVNGQANAQANAQANDKQLLNTCLNFAAVDTDTDSELDSEPDSEPEKELKIYSPNGESSTQGVARCPHGEIVALFSEVLPELPAVKVMSEAWRKTLRVRWREDKARQNLDWWRDYFQQVKVSDFLMGRAQGKSGRPPFVATFAWLIAPSNMAKVLNGNYANHGRGSPIAAHSRSPNIGDHFRAMADEILAEASGQGQVIDMADFSETGGG